MTKKHKTKVPSIPYIVIDTENDDPYINVNRIKVKGLTRRKGVRFAFDAIKLSGVDTFLLYLVIGYKYLEQRIELDGVVSLPSIPAHFAVPVKHVSGSSLDIVMAYIMTKITQRINVAKSDDGVEIAVLTPVGQYKAKVAHATAEPFFNLDNPR